MRNILFFNLDTLTRKAKCNPSQMVSLLHKYYLEKKNKKYISLNLAGKSFILNPDVLFTSLESDIYKAQYIVLAAKRDYFLYTKYGVSNLQLSYYPDLNIDKIKYNPLITITKTEIKFKE